MRPDGFAVSSYASVRYSLLHAAIDRADLGVRVRHGAHSIEPAVEYFYPTFDGDSIFNAFSLEPTTDARLGYQFTPQSPWRASASAWVRSYAHDDDLPSLAGGADASIEHVFGDAWRGRVDGLYDDGWGGRRVGGAADAAWRRTSTNYLRGRFVVLGVHEDDTSSQQRRYVTSSAVLSSTFRIGDAAALHVIGEGDYDAIHNLQTRFLAVLDLNFSPEP
jgi:hypothetical protein